MNKDKIIKDLKERNDKLLEQYRYQDIRCITLETRLEQLQERIDYLERSNNRREDEILSLRQELNDSNDKIDKAIEYIHNNQPVFELSSKEQIQEWFEKEYYIELLKTLRGDSNEN